MRRSGTITHSNKKCGRCNKDSIYLFDVKKLLFKVCQECKEKFTDNPSTTQRVGLCFVDGKAVVGDKEQLKKYYKEHNFDCRKCDISVTCLNVKRGFHCPIRDEHMVDFDCRRCYFFKECGTGKSKFVKGTKKIEPVWLSVLTSLPRPAIPKYSSNRYPEAVYISLWNAQNGCCLGCGKSLTPFSNIRDKNWGWIDHNHQTGEVRGLLCGSCNVKDVLKGKSGFRLAP